MTDVETNLFVKPEFFWLDFESNGLHRDGDVYPLEIGFGLTDAAGNLGRTYQSLILHDIETSVIRDNWTNPFVREMHTQSGLWKALEAAEAEEDHNKYSVEFIESRIIDILRVHRVEPETLVLAGSTVNFDRQILVDDFPKLNAFLHYRNIDVSSLKELCRRLNPSVYAKRPVEGGPGWTPKQHRPVADIKDSIREYIFYKENFLFEG